MNTPLLDRRARSEPWRLVPPSAAQKLSDAARVFAAQFYSAIGFGYSIARAFAQARAALMLEGIPEEGTPELFVAPGLSADSIVLVRASPSEQDGATLDPASS